MLVKLLLLKNYRIQSFGPFGVVSIVSSIFLHFFLSCFQTFLEVLFRNSVYVLRHMPLCVHHAIKICSFHETLTFWERIRAAGSENL